MSDKCAQILPIQDEILCFCLARLYLSAAVLLGNPDAITVFVLKIKRISVPREVDIRGYLAYPYHHEHKNQ